MFADLGELDDRLDDGDVVVALTGMTNDGVGLTLNLLATNPWTGGTTFSARIRCERPVDWVLRHGSVTQVQTCADHPAAELHRERWVEVYVRGVPDDIDGLVRDLQVLHDDRVGEYLRFADAINDVCPPREVLRIGYGILGTGPASVMTEWVRLLDGHGLATALLPGRAAVDHELLGLELGCGFVVAERFELGQA